MEVEWFVTDMPLERLIGGLSKDEENREDVENRDAENRECERCRTTEDEEKAHTRATWVMKAWRDTRVRRDWLSRTRPM